MEVDAIEDSNEVENEEGMTAEEMAEDRQRAEEYKIWRKNTPFLYDTVVTQLGVAFFDGAVDAQVHFKGQKRGTQVGARYTHVGV